MTVSVTEIMTTGDARRFVLETMLALRNKEISATDAMAMAANMKVLNDSMQIELNAAKIAIATKGEAVKFVDMGKRLLTS